jgi:hypothetical protein
VGGEAYVPMARAIVGGMMASVTTGIVAVPLLWYVVNSRRPRAVHAEGHP